MLHASAIHPQNSSVSLRFKRKIRAIEIIDFSRELSLLLNTGISITNALSMVAGNHEKREMKTLVSNIQTDIETGKLLGNVLVNYPEHFSPFFIQLILIGEQSGTLELRLKQAADHLEKWLDLKNKLKKSLTYPCFVLLLTCLIMGGVLIFIVPQFQTLFKSFDSELPWLTRFVIQVSHHFKYAILFLMIGLSICTAIFFQFKKNTFQRPIFLDQFFLKIPFLGHIFKQHFIARICHLLAVTYGAGISFPNALILLSETIKNQVYSKALTQIRLHIQQGALLHQAIENAKIFPKRLTQMIYIGEQSGELLILLKKMGDYYENQMTQRLEQINKLLEPVMIIVLGISIGFLIIAMYLPIFRIGSLF